MSNYSLVDGTSYRGSNSMYIDFEISRPIPIFPSATSYGEAVSVESFSLGNAQLGGEETEETYSYGLSTIVLGSSSYYYLGDINEGTNMISDRRWSTSSYVFITPSYKVDGFEKYSTSENQTPYKFTSSWKLFTLSSATDGEDGHFIKKIIGTTSSEYADLRDYNIVTLFGRIEMISGDPYLGVRFVDGSSGSTPTHWISVSSYPVGDSFAWFRYECDINWGACNPQQIREVWLTAANTLSGLIDDIFVLKADRRLMGVGLDYSRDVAMSTFKVPFRTYEWIQIGGRKNIRGTVRIVDLQEKDINYIRELRNMSAPVYIRANNFGVPGFIENWGKQYRRFSQKGLGFNMDINFIEEDQYGE